MPIEVAGVLGATMQGISSNGDHCPTAQRATDRLDGVHLAAGVDVVEGCVHYFELLPIQAACHTL